MNERLRNILSGSVNWKPAKNLEITGRLSYDTSSSSYDGYNVPRWDDSVLLPNFMTPISFISQRGLQPGTQKWQDEYNEALAANRKAMQEMEAFDFPEPFLVSETDPAYEEELEKYNAAYAESQRKYNEYYMSVPYLARKVIEDMD